ncbi:DUF4139 domain-containing protein [Streptomyces sp. NPDC090025]|uniref:DUF4139 domain-containing protein n=1 Tax=Streptomyces sp. NPDC090025 TaxID=3365922 RepID=UPI003832F44B
MNGEERHEDSWDSVLDEVVVYARGALCTRVARGAVPADGRVRVSGLPRTVEAGSLRVRVVDGDGVRVTGARVELAAAPVVDDTARDPLRAEVTRLRQAVEAARARRNRQSGVIEEVAALRPVPPPPREDEPHRRTPVAAWLELTDFIEQRLTGLHAGLTRLDTELNQAEHALSVAEGRLAAASTDVPSPHVATALTAVLALEGPAGREVGLALEYGVPEALWVPAYRLAYGRGDGAEEGRLVLRASVAQCTGEDWTGVRIAFATADLRRRTELPKLASIRLGRSGPPAAPAGWREPPAGLDGLFAGYDEAGPPPAVRRPALEGVVAVAGAASAPAPAQPPRPVPGPAAARSRAVAGRPGAGGGAPALASLPAPGSVPAPPGSAPLPPAPAAAPSGPGAAYGGASDGVPELTTAYRAASRSAAPPSPPSAPAPAPSMPSLAPVPGPPQPREDELDYASLVLSGPDESAARRGRLFPAVAPSTDRTRGRAADLARLPLPRGAVRPRESAGSFDHRYDAAARADIPSDGVWHTVTVGEIPVGVRTEYVTVPAVEQTVYATVVLTNTTGQALLAGGVEVAGADGLLVSAVLPTLGAGDVRRVGLGPAEGVRVTRRLQRHESSAGLRGGTTVFEHRVRVELANTLARPVTVEVRERVPVTTEPDARIQERADWVAPETATRDDGAPEGAEGTEAVEHAPGTRLWRVELPAGGSVALDGAYEIRIPAGKTPARGEQRS